MRLICSESFLSISAMMASMVLIASSEMRDVAPSACAARVCTAVLTADLASEDLGLNSFLRRDSNSERTSVDAAPDWAWGSNSGTDMLGFLLVRLARGLIVFGFGSGGNSLQKSGIIQQFLDQFLRAAFAIHVGEEIGKFRARGQKLVQRVHLARDRGGRKIIHAFESHFDRDVAFTGEGVGNLEGDARLAGLEALVEIVHVNLHELAVPDGGEGFGRLAGEVRHDAHDEGQFDFFLRAIQLNIVFDLHAGGAVAGDEL